MFGAATDTSRSPPSGCAASTAAYSAVNGTHTPTPAPPPSSGRSSSTYVRASDAVLCIFQLPATNGRRSGVIERLHPGERASLEQLQGGAAARREVIDSIGEPEALERGGRV